MKELENIILNKDQYNPESQQKINDWIFAKQELDKLETMKRTEGWKVLEDKIRATLQTRILHLVKDDAEIQSLLGLLIVADTRTQKQILENEIKNTIPE